MRPFRERNPLPIGIAGLATAGLATLLAFNLQHFAGGTTYSAAFSEAAGLKAGEEVRIAGVKVGKVSSVDLDGDHVKVKFTSSARFGTQTRAQIKIKTLLGSHFLSLDPKGPGQQPAGREIPLSRTTAPYEVVPALQDASAQLGKIDTKQLAKAMDTLTQTMEGTPENVRRTLAGLQKVSRAVSSRDDELNELLKHSGNVTSLLAARSGDLAVLVQNGGLLLQEINDRRAVIDQLLTGTVSLSQQITATIHENQATLNPALRNLQKVVQILQRNQANLEKSFALMGPFGNELTDLTGNGRWFDVYIQNLIPLPVSIAPPSTRGDTTQPTPAPKTGKKSSGKTNTAGRPSKSPKTGGPSPSKTGTPSRSGSPSPSKSANPFPYLP
ncbi:MCE family protein [Actinoallomurus spadix]|uniref:MCE family protein n=1 Tax=Actinoallomurus spadix TaxID=79912 RepID=A0ABN0WGF9_9ACTN|nr:MCE family protein [Actinoallomurus spadix]MCO5989350.1 MCE family protein [Actinoallomurus spadix]